MKSLIGQVVNYRYETVEKTAEGNIFTVYRSRDKVMNRLVALKVLKPEFAADGEFAGRLIALAKKMVPLSHPNLARVFDAEAAPDAVYVAEEHVRGIDLKERIRRIAPFTTSSAVDVAVAIASAVDYLHASGVVHGDIRPQKVLMGPDGEIKMTGAALAFASADNQGRRGMALMRSAHYSSPESFEGGLPDARTDVYAMGVMLYEMLTATLPYEGETPIAVAMRHSSDPVPSARDLNAAVPRALDGVIAKAMAKNPGDRYQSAREMLDDLRAVQESLRMGRSLAWSPEEGRPSHQVAPSARKVADESIWKMLLKSALLVLLVAAVVFAAFVFLLKPTAPEASVPNLLGLTVSEARQRLSAVDLRLEVVREEHNERYDADQIYFSNPSAGQQAKTDSVVYVYVSKGSRNVRLPNVVGVPEAEARETLLQQGIIVGELEHEYSDSVPAASIIRQDPKGGTSLPRDKALVDIVVSLGLDPSKIVVPPPEPTTPEPPQAEGPERKLNVKFDIPEEGPPRRVEIVVIDVDGQRTIIDKAYNAGETVSASITARGTNVRIITYLDGKEIDRQIK